MTKVQFGGNLTNFRLNNNNKKNKKKNLFSLARIDKEGAQVGFKLQMLVI